MNLGQMRERVRLSLDNLATSDPWYSAIDSFINRCANVFLRLKIDMAPWDLTPEMDRDWVIGPTYPIDGTVIINANTIRRPTDCIMVRSVFRAESATSPNWAVTQGLPVTYQDKETFEQLAKDTSTDGYIRIFSRHQATLKVWPTITSGYPDYLHIYGPAAEVALTGDSQSFVMPDHWHDLVCVLTARDLARRMSKFPLASMLDTQLQQEIGQTADVESLSDGAHVVEVHGSPSAGTIYPGWGG